MVMSCNKCRVSMRFGFGNTTSDSQPPSVLESYNLVSIIASFFVWFHPIWPETAFARPLLPPILRRKTFYVSRRELLTDTKSCVNRILNYMEFDLPERCIELVTNASLNVLEANPSRDVMSVNVTVKGVKFVRSPDVLERLMMDIATGISESESWTIRAGKASVEGLEYVTIEEVLRDYDKECCTICLEEYFNDDQEVIIVRTPCLHVYHKNCILEWLDNDPRCPVCRYSMPVDP